MNVPNKSGSWSWLVVGLWLMGNFPAIASSDAVGKFKIKGRLTQVRSIQEVSRPEAGEKLE